MNQSSTAQQNQRCDRNYLNIFIAFIVVSIIGIIMIPMPTVSYLIFS